jgi:hypothetical protein
MRTKAGWLFVYGIEETVDELGRIAFACGAPGWVEWIDELFDERVEGAVWGLACVDAVDRLLRLDRAAGVQATADDEVLIIVGEDNVVELLEQREEIPRVFRDGEAFHCLVLLTGVVIWYQWWGIGVPEMGTFM